MRLLTYLLICSVLICCGEEERNEDENPGSPGSEDESASTGRTSAQTDGTGAVSLAGRHDDPEKSAICASEESFHNADSETKLVQGRIVFITPSSLPASDTDRRYYLEGMANSFDRIATYLNIDLDLPCIVVRRQYGCYSVPSVSPIPVGNNNGIEMRFCMGAALALNINPDEPVGHIHEMTHVLVSRTAMTGYLNEGLADYMEDSQRANYHSQWSGTRECHEDSFTYLWNGFETKSYNKYNERLPAGTPGIERYISAACFWDWVETEYGHDKFQELMVLLSNNRQLYSSAFKLKEHAIGPVLGQAAVDRLTETWGIPDGAN